MKKLLCIILTAIMVLSLCLPCMAEEAFKLKDGEELIIIKAEDFKDDLGRWVLVGSSANSILSVLHGAELPDSAELAPANTTVSIDKAGTYYVHALALDFAENQPATRHFTVALDDELMPEKAGTHRQEGWKWQLLGQKDLQAGEVKVSLVDTSNFFGRCQAIALTTDKDFVGPTDKEIISVSNKYSAGQKTDVKIPTNKLGKAVMLFLGSPKAYVMGKESKIDKSNTTVVPFTENDRTLVPVRFISESFGGKVDFDDATQTVTVESNGKVIKMVLGKAEMTVDGTVVTLDTPANTYQDRTFIPLRAMAEAINKEVFWDDRGLIIISDLTFDATGDKALIENAVSGFGGTKIDFSVVAEDLSSFIGKVDGNDYMLDYFHPSELTERNGLVNTINKLKNGEEVTVAFFGGSITAQDGSWRTKILKWLSMQYPNAKINEVNVTLSGTGADLAVCRADAEAVAFNPDLVFFEYAVNGGTSQNAEGFVRKFWKNNPETDIFFVYTLRAGYINSYQNNVVSSYERAYEVVADYYGIPSVSLAFQIAELYEKDLVTLQADTPEEGKILLTNDGSHPTEEGSVLYTGAVARAIATMDKHTVTEKFIHELKEPLFKDNWENAKAYDYSFAEFKGEWKELVHDGSSYGEDFAYNDPRTAAARDASPKLMGTKTPGASFTVTFTGTKIGVFDLGGPYSGQLKVTIDGQDYGILSCHTGYNSQIRNQYIFAPTLPYGEHTATFTLDSAIPDKTKMIDYNERKAEYDKGEFYLSKILVVGEIK